MIDTIRALLSIQQRGVGCSRTQTLFIHLAVGGYENSVGEIVGLAIKAYKDAPVISPNEVKSLELIINKAARHFAGGSDSINR